MHLTKSALKLHGRSTKHNIFYKSIQKMYLLPKPQSNHVAFVLTLDTALRQGQTTYKNVVVQFDHSKVIQLKLNLPDEEIDALSSKFEGIKKEMTGSQVEVVATVIKALTNKQLISPGKEFRSSQNFPCIRCSHKAQEGDLYFLGKSFIFIPKPVIICKYDDISRIEFSRTSGSQTRFFEFRVEKKEKDGNIDFTSIDRSEYQLLVDFCKQRGIKIINMEQEAATREKMALMELDEDESDDDDFDEEDAEQDESDDDDDDDDEEDEEQGAKIKAERAPSKSSTPSKSSSSKGKKQ
eukprot:GHVN01101995.1.p1 GENE.GHVN01101995.1~~GHVN01101995.1.p1  ORF type:complete len:295 (+),score=55.64 GHVN01101995.1:946-1830(+)